MFGLRLLVSVFIALVFCLSAASSVLAQQAEQPAPTNQPDSGQAQQRQETIDQLQEPLYTPFVERYILDELRTLRVDMAAQRHDLMQQILDREHSSVDRGVSYVTNSITYFFYLIAGATSLLVIAGWTSIRDIKERVHSLADEEINKLVTEYEHRLGVIEQQLNQKTQHIRENREEIELTQEIQSLWLRAQQEHGSANKIHIYDQILQLRPDDIEALTYKADAVLELGEPQWAANLCHQALLVDSRHGHALYQLARAYATLAQPDEAVKYLASALEQKDSYREEIFQELAFEPLWDYGPFKELMNIDQEVDE